MEKRIIISTLMTMTFLLSYGQLPMSEELKIKLERKLTFNDVMQTVTDYYIQKEYTKNPKMFREFKKWNRWAWYECRHLDQKGNFTESYLKNEAAMEFIRNQEKESGGENRMSNTGLWYSKGPDVVPNGIGRVDRVAFHPTDPNHIYAGTPASGLWQTTNGGTWWTPLNGYIPGLGVSGIIVNIDNPANLFVLTGDGDSNINGGLIYTRSSIGILTSNDGGNTWSKESNIVSPGTTFWGYKLIQSNTFHYIFFAGTSDGLYRSTNFGATWERNSDIGTENVFDIEQTDDGYVYASTERRVYISSDFGSSFNIISNDAFSTPPTVLTTRTSVSVSPNSPDLLYVHFGGDKLLYRSTNKGSSFTQMTNNAPSSIAYTSAMTVNPLDDDNIICGSLKVMPSFDGGANFTDTGLNVHDDIHDLAFNPLDNVLWAAGDGGVYKSVTNGLNLTGLYNGMNTTQYYHMGCAPGNNEVLMAGAQDNGTHLRENNNPFVSVNTGDGFESKFLNDNPDVVYYSLNAGVFRYTISTNSSSLKFAPGSSINDQNFFFPHLAIHPSNDNIIYAGFISGVYRSVNDGVNWTNLGQSASAGFAAAGGLAVSDNRPDRIYAANASTLLLSDNQGTNWTTISGNAGWPGGVLTITDIQTRNNDADEIWVTFGGYGGPKVIYSPDAGNNWTDFTGSLPDLPVYSIEYTNDGDAYIGTDGGVYFMDFLMNDWVRFSNGLPLIPVTEVVVDEVHGTINAATFGRGIWQSDLYNDCGPALFLSGLTQGSYFYQSNGFIETTQQIPSSLGNSLRLRSPQKIIFKPGFRLGNNAYMHALIGACGQGVFNLSGSNIERVISKSEVLKLKSEKVNGD